MAKDEKLESKIQKDIIAYLRGRGGEVLNFHGGAFQTPGIPDLYYAEASLGQMWFEVKRTGEPHPVTALQAVLFDKLEAQDVPVFVVHSVEEVVTALTNLEEHVCSVYACPDCKKLRWRFRREVKPNGDS